MQDGKETINQDLDYSVQYMIFNIDSIYLGHNFFIHFLKSLANFLKFGLIFLDFIQFYKDSDQIYQDSDTYFKILALFSNLETEK